MNSFIKLIGRGKQIIRKAFFCPSDFYSRNRYQRAQAWKILSFFDKKIIRNNSRPAANRICQLDTDKMSGSETDTKTETKIERGKGEKTESARDSGDLLEINVEGDTDTSIECGNSNTDADKKDESAETGKMAKRVDADDNNPELTKKNVVGCNTSEIFARKGPRKRKRQFLHQTFKRPKMASDEVMSQTRYYFENGLRKVVPYDHQFNTFCKGRWIGMTLKEIYSKEFRLLPIEHYEKAIQKGRLLLNLKQPESINVVVGDNDLLTSIIHRHECPVSNEPLEIIADDENFFVINKPSSIPIHPAGRFRHNTIVVILAKEYNVKNVHSLHRLDRMTSGLLLFAKNRETAAKVHNDIKERLVEKEYVCRVVGDFSKFKLDDAERKIKIEGENIVVSEPLKVHDYKIGVTVVSNDEDAKESETVFRFLSGDGETSVVSCKPKTGRTHQIRVHLQYLGYPITNDPSYNHPAWGQDRFKLGSITKPMEEVIKGLEMKWQPLKENYKQILNKENDAADVDNSEPSKAVEHTEEKKMPQIFEDLIKEGEEIIPFRPECEECIHPLPDPLPSELVMYLHALRYRGPDWSFETDLPVWAKPGWCGER